MDLYTPDDIKSFPPIAWLADHLIPLTGLCVVYGPPNIGKSFVTLDLAHSIGHQLDWLGRRTRKGRVAYVAAGEGISGLKSRILGWERARGRTVKDIRYLTVATNLMDSREASTFLQEIEPFEPSLIVFDTLSRCLGGGDQNSSKDLSRAINTADELRRHLGCTVIFVHHPTKPHPETGRSHLAGSFVLEAAADTCLEIAPASPDVRDMRRTLYTRKQKDAEQAHPIHFTLRKILGRHSPATALVPDLP